MNNFCQNCGKKLEADEKFCQNCGTPTGTEGGTFQGNNFQKPQKKKSGCLIVVLTLVFFIIFSVGGLLLTMGQNAAIQKSVSGVNDNSEYITMEEYNQIQSGMTYEQVAEIVGSSGEITAESSGGGMSVVVVTWYGNGMAGSNANVTFMNNEVTGKAQVGLK